MYKLITILVVVTAVSFFHPVDYAGADIVVNVNARLNVPPTVSGSAGEATQFLTAGDYTFTLVNNIMGHASYDPQANYTAWSYHTPGSNWGTNYSFAYDDNDSTNDTLSSPPYVGPDRAGGGNSTNSSSPLEAFEATSADRLSFLVHIPIDQTVGFYFSDNVISDNAGGVSVRISPASVPEPATAGSLVIVGIGLLLRRRRR